MKHTFILRISCLFLCLCLILPILCFPVAAEADSPREKDAANDISNNEETEESLPTYVDWQISEDGDFLTANNRVYYLFELPFSLIHDPATVYQSFDTVTIPYLSSEDYERESAVYATHANSEIVWLTFGNNYYYATESALEKLRDYVNGATAEFRLQQEGEYATLAMDDVQDIFDQANTGAATRVTVDVQALSSLPCFELIARDATGTFSYVRGTIYQFDNGDYYFIDHKTLDNTHFDAYGNFSYRSGTVSLVLLSDQTSIALYEAKEGLAWHDIVFTYEDEGYVEENVIIFWIFFILIGFLLPLPFLIIGLCLPHSYKRGYPKYWYKLSLCAAVWIAISIVITIILLFVQ